MEVLSKLQWDFILSIRPHGHTTVGEILSAFPAMSVYRMQDWDRWNILVEHGLTRGQIGPAFNLYLGFSEADRVWINNESRFRGPVENQYVHNAEVLFLVWKHLTGREIEDFLVWCREMIPNWYGDRDPGPEFILGREF